MKKRLDDEATFQEILKRIHELNENSVGKWGRMTVGQMLVHCNKIIEVANGNINLPKIHPILYSIGVLTKKEMSIFNNGIPHNMPTFRKLVVDSDCNFEISKEKLLDSLQKFKEKLKREDLPSHHQLFGKMSTEDWAFLQYKHLNHHLKQFGV